MSEVAPPGPRRCLALAAAALGAVSLATSAVRAQRLAPPDAAPPAGLAVSQYQHDRWTTADGLANHAIDWIARSPDGYLWLGTEGGLVRFDGVRFTAIDRSNTPALRGTDYFPTIPLHVDRRGVLWIVTSGGLVRYADGEFTRVAAAGQAAAPPITRMVEDRAGRLWTWEREIDGRLYEVRDGRLVSPDPRSGLPAHVSAVAADPEGDLWVATVDRALLRVHDGRAVPALPRGAMPDGVTTLYAARGGVLWVGTQRGFARLSNGRLEFRRLGAGGLAGYVSAFAEDAAGDVWIGTVGMGVLRWHAGRLERFDRRDGLSRDQVVSLLVDREGNIWVGTRGGLDRLRRGAVATFTPRNGGPPFADPGALLWDRRGRFVVAGATTGLVAGRASAWAPLPGAAASRKVWTLAPGRGGIWVGGDGTLTLYRTSGIAAAPRVYTARDGLAGKWVLAVAEDSLGRVWVGTDQGLFRLTAGRPGPAREFTTADGLPHAYVRALVADRRGAVWAGTNGGVAQVVGDSVRSWGPADGLAGSYVFAIRELGDGTLWIGTSGGLTRVRDGRLAPVRAEQGLPGELVTAIEEDGGDLWIVTGRGISRVPLAELNAVADGRAPQVHATTFGTRDGLPATEVVAGAQPLSARTPDSRLWFSTAAGLAVVDPRRVPRNAIAPAVHVEEVVVDGRVLPPGELTRIDPNPRRVQVHFTAASLRMPERVRVEYRLDGVDPDWQPAGAPRVIAYTQLRPGRYRFRVRAWNEDGVPSAGEAVRALRVLPAWYQTWWAITLGAGGVAGAGAVAAVALSRVRRRRAELAAQAALAERLRVARELHDTVLSDMAGVAMSLDAVARGAGAGAGGANGAVVADLRDQVRRTLAETRRAVTALRASGEELVPLAARLSDAAGHLFAGTDVAVRVSEAGPARRYAPELEAEALRIATEALTNARKHAGCRAVVITCRYDRHGLGVWVRDDGRGFDPGGVSRDGHFGLTGMRERAAAVGGRLTVESAPGRGTTVRLEVPARPTA
jgi:signal transduction histidine kinase/ligand-binding sensor domain-containing protein